MVAHKRKNKNKSNKKKPRLDVGYGPELMFPSLHARVAAALASHIDPAPCFLADGDDISSTRNYNTNIMGTFRCTNGACKQTTWGSKVVAIHIRQYKVEYQDDAGDDGVLPHPSGTPYRPKQMGYNAVVYNQQCRNCKKLGVLTLDEESYVERVAYRLKVWAGVQVARPPFKPGEGPPHRSELCEGCKRGRCRLGKRVEIGF